MKTRNFMLATPVTFEQSGTSQNPTNVGQKALRRTKILIKNRNSSCCLLANFLRFLTPSQTEPMTRFTRLILTIAAAFTLLNVTNADTVTTAPVGFENTTVASGSVATLCVPMDRIARYQSAVSSRTATTLTTTGAGWATSGDPDTPGQTGPFGPFSAIPPTNQNPHAVIMLSGNSIGRRFLIDSNTGDTLTITTGGDLTTLIANGDTYKIIPCHTLASVFGADGAGLNNTNFPSTADNIQIREAGVWSTYFHTANPNGFWARVGSGGSNFNKAPILPEQGFVLVRRPSSNYTFTGLGAVPITNLQTDFPANSVTHFANRFPTATTLDSLGLHTRPGWIHGGSAGSTDNVQIRSGGVWQTFFHTSPTGFWAMVGGGAGNFNNQPIAVGEAILVVRRPGTAITLTQTIPYNPFQ